MKLFMVHVGFYDEETGEGIYESHVNFFVAAGNAKSAKKKTFQMEITGRTGYSVGCVWIEIKTLGNPSIRIAVHFWGGHVDIFFYKL